MLKAIEVNSDYISRLESLVEIADILKNESDFKHVMQIITEKAQVSFTADLSLLMMINPQTHNTIKTVFAGREESADHSNHSVNRSVSGWVIKFKTGLLSMDIRKDTRFRSELIKKTTYKSVLCSPLFAENVIIGTLLLAREKDAPFEDQTLEYLNQFSAIVSPFLRNVQKIQQFFNYKIPDATLLDKYAPLGLIGKCKKFVELLQTIETAAESDIRVLLEGESGTGKELVARAIHQFSARSDKKFVALDCSTIPENLMESTLFGHIKGAFSGATESYTGLIKEANNGTLFLDEIVNIPLTLQTKLLRFLQEGEIRQIGSNIMREVDVRIISASSNSLYQLVQQNKFREDLFYRLYVFPIKIPPLSERKEDIPTLANFFLNKFARQHQKKLRYLQKQILDHLFVRKWSGNIRELENFVERMVALAPADIEILDHENLPREFRKEIGLYKPKMKAGNGSLFKSVADYERELIRKTLAENDWNQAASARILKISEATIRYKIKKYKITKTNG